MTFCRADKAANQSRLQSLRNKIEHLQLREQQRVQAKVPPPPLLLLPLILACPYLLKRVLLQLLRPQLGLADGEGDDQYVVALQHHVLHEPTVCRLGLLLGLLLVCFCFAFVFWGVHSAIKSAPGAGFGCHSRSAFAASP